MTSSSFPHPESSSPGEFVTINQATFSRIYDQYAPTLLGVISTIVGDEAEAVRLLEVTFAKISSQFGQARPESQPLFVWLLSIARSTALEATKNQNKPSPPILQLTNAGTIVSASVRSNSTTPVAGRLNPVPSSRNEFIDAVLFKNCTPEETAASIGTPPATARQQLRLAMQQLRTLPSI